MGIDPYKRTRTSPTFLSKSGSEKRSRGDTTFRRSVFRRNLREERHRCGRCEAREGSFETMGFKWRFFWYFSFAIERKVRTFRVKGLSLRQKSSIFATSSLLSVTLRVTSLLAEESLALVRGRQGTVCHRPRRDVGPALRQDRGRFASPVGGGVHDAPQVQRKSPWGTPRFSGLSTSASPYEVYGRSQSTVVGGDAHIAPSTYDSIPIDAAGCGHPALQ